jgi:hypothetical protein
MTADEFREWVRTSPWHVAKTMPETSHEYSLRREAPDEAAFERVVIHIRKAGYQQKFRGRVYTYCDCDGYQYWTMGAPLELTILINRASLAFKGK